MARFTSADTITESPYSTQTGNRYSYVGNDPLAFTDNPLSRSDANTNLSESFAYDALNRLTSTTVNLSPAPLAKTFSYSPIGNLLSKSDVGNYTYPAPGSPQPHAVMGVSGGAISTPSAMTATATRPPGSGAASPIAPTTRPPASLRALGPSLPRRHRTLTFQAARYPIYGYYRLWFRRRRCLRLAARAAP